MIISQNIVEEVRVGGLAVANVGLAVVNASVTDAEQWLKVILILAQIAVAIVSTVYISTKLWEYFKAKIRGTPLGKAGE